MVPRNKIEKNIKKIIRNEEWLHQVSSQGGF
jgi:hypothetical protein